MSTCELCGELLGDLARPSPWSGRLLCGDCRELADEEEPADLEDRLDVCLRPTQATDPKEKQRT
jgi:hypothetical protein